MDILCQAIPAPEQLGRARLQQLIDRDDYHLYAFQHDSIVAGMAILYLPERQDFAWLDYMAVSPDLMGLGRGSDLFRGLVKIVTQERPTAGYLVLEVDDDRCGLEAVRSMNRRRIEFYRRLGARLLANVDYLFPSPNGPAVSMRLMVCCLRDDVRVSQETMGSAIEDVFITIHGRAKSDTLLRSIVDHLPSELLLQ